MPVGPHLAPPSLSSPCQFECLSAPIELIPVIGAENTALLVQQAVQMGGLDFVLIHPQFLSDRSQVGAREGGEGVHAHPPCRPSKS